MMLSGQVLKVLDKTVAYPDKKMMKKKTFVSDIQYVANNNICLKYSIFCKATIVSVRYPTSPKRTGNARSPVMDTSFIYKNTGIYSSHSSSLYIPLFFVLWGCLKVRYLFLRSKERLQTFFGPDLLIRTKLDCKIS